MPSLNLDVSLKKDWLPANPWLWLLAGVGLTAWSLAWTLSFRPFASDGRILVLVLGLLVSGVGVWLRQRNPDSLYLANSIPPLARLLRVAIGILFALLAIGVTLLLIASFLYPVEVGERSAWWTRLIGFCERTIGLHVGPAILVWLSLFPVAAAAARGCILRKIGQGTLEAREEIGLAFAVLAGCCLMGSFTLVRDPSDAGDWDSMRLFLRVAAVVCVYASGLTLVSMGLRRMVMSLLFLLHFTGICTACLSAPPAPWIVQQTWMRLFRPYLEFMYLNNAYHFYAPDPGPSSYLWFRVIFTDDEAPPDANGKKPELGIWHKLPQLDEHGRTKHPVPLEYQRYLSLTESIVQTDPLPSEFHVNEKTGLWERRPFYEVRGMLAQGPQGVIVGVDRSKHFPIPLHPQIPNTQQVNIPADGPRRLLSSFARHIAHRYPTHTDEKGRTLTFKSVKIYRVIHAIPPIDWFQFNLPPTDPTLYRPFYVGNYDADGVRIDDKDPYLYWLLPILRDPGKNPNPDLKSQVILDYARLHAGDPEWKRQPGAFD